MPRTPVYEPYEPHSTAEDEYAERLKSKSRLSSFEDVIGLPAAKKIMAQRPEPVETYKRQAELAQNIYVFIEKRAKSYKDASGKVVERRDIIETKRIYPDQFESTRKDLEERRIKGEIKRYYFGTKSDYENLLRQRKAEQQRGAKKFQTQLRYPGREQHIKEMKAGTKEILKGFAKQRKQPIQMPRQVVIDFGMQPTTRSNFWSPENQSTLTKEQSQFGPSVLAPKFISKNQTFIKKPPFTPQFIGQRNQLTGERSTNFNPFVVGRKDIITGERQTMFKPKFIKL